MIDKIMASNYRSLGANTTIRFGDLTALVGPNGSGKSNAADSIQFIADCMSLRLEGAITKRHGIRAIRRWSAGHPHNIAFTVHVRSNQLRATYSFTIAGAREDEYRVASESAKIVYQQSDAVEEFEIRDGRWERGPKDLRPSVDTLNLALPLVAGDNRFKPLAEELKAVAVYSIFPDTLRSPQKYDPAKPMKVHGDNWVSILKDQPESSWKGELSAALLRLTGDVQDIRVQPVAGFVTAQFQHKVSQGNRNKWFDSNQESDGTLRVAGMVTALLQDPPLTAVGIEEPELTVHPGAIPLVGDFLKQAAKRSQVIITTHSPDLLDHVSAEDVRVVERLNGATTIQGIDSEQKDEVRERLTSLGELMRAEGLKQQQLPLGQE